MTSKKSRRRSKSSTQPASCTTAKTSVSTTSALRRRQSDDSGRRESESDLDDRATAADREQTTTIVEVEEALDATDIAELSPIQISRMTPEELIRVIEASPLPQLRPEIECHLKYYDRQLLERLVYLARQCCRKKE